MKKIRTYDEFEVAIEMTEKGGGDEQLSLRERINNIPYKY